MNREFFTGSDNTIMNKVESMEDLITTKVSIKTATTGSGGSTKLKVGDVLLSFGSGTIIPFQIKSNTTEYASLVKTGASATSFTVSVATEITVSNGSVKLGSASGKSYSYIES